MASESITTLIEPLPERCQLLCMTDKASPAGWVVQVTAPNGGEPPVFAFYNVAVMDYEKAIELVRMRLDVTIARVSVVRPLTAGDLATARSEEWRGEASMNKAS